LDKFVHRLISTLSNDRPVTLNGADGIPSNQIFIDDAVRLIADAFEVNGWFTVDFAGKEIVRRRSLCDRIGNYLGKSPFFTDAESAANDYVGDIALQTELFGLPRVTLDEELTHTTAARKGFESKSIR